MAEVTVRTVRIDVIIRERGTGTQQVDRSIRNVGRGVRRTTSRFRRLTSVIQTMSKALISGAIVLAAFTALITIPEAVFRGLTEAIQEAIKRFSEFEQRVLGLQGIIATSLKLSADPVENFTKAGELSLNLLEKLALRTSEFVGGLNEAGIVLQTLLARGGAEVVRNSKEIVDLTIALVNAISGVTAGQQLERQLAEETGALIQGQFKATSLLVRLLFPTGKEAFEKFAAEARATGDFVQRIIDKLRPFQVLSLRLGRTFEGIAGSLRTILDLVIVRGLGDTLTKLQQRIADELKNAEQEINRLAAAVGAAFDVLFKNIGRIVQKELLGTNTITNFKELVDFLVSEKGIPRLTGALVTFFGFLRNVFNILSLIGRALLLVFRIATQLFTIIQKVIEFLTDPKALERVSIAILKLFVITIPELLEALTTGNIEKFIETTKPLLKSFFAEFIPDLFKTIAPEGFLLDLFEQFKTILTDLNSLISDESAFALGAEAAKDAFTEIESKLRDILAVQQQRNTAEQAFQTIITADIDLIDENVSQIVERSRILRQTALDQLDINRLIREGFGLKISALVPSDLDAISAELKKILGDLVSVTIGAGQFGDKAAILRDKIKRLETETLTLKEAFSLLNAVQKALETGEAFPKSGDLKQAIALIEQVRGEMVALQGTIVTLEKANLQFNRTLEQFLDDVLQVRVLLPFLNDIFNKLKDPAAKFTSNFTSLIKSIKDALFSKEGIVELAIALGNRLASTLERVFQGTESLGNAIRDFIADVFVMLGGFLLVLGTGSLIVGVLTGDFKAITAGLEAIALGLTLIAIGAAIRPGRGESGAGGGGGGGGNEEVRSFAFRQEEIATQQAQITATNNLTNATENLVAVISGLSAARPGDVLIKGFEQQGGLTRMLEKDTRKASNLTTTANLGKVLLGGT